MAYRDSQSFFAAPQAAVYLLLTVNILVFALCLKLAGTPELPGALLYRYGAMYASALPRQEYWRLIAYGFLHSNLVHLLTNMLCLLLWGGQLERRLGWTYFVVVYGCALVFGAIVGDAIHAKPYLTVGASGATSGILGALLCLWILGRTDLPGNFFIINIGLNVVLALSNPRIDWGVHAGGSPAPSWTCSKRRCSACSAANFPSSPRPTCSCSPARPPSCGGAPSPAQRSIASRPSCLRQCSPSPALLSSSWSM
jgi:membrane associated rhomboid family serine protease